MLIGDRLRELRKSKKLSQGDIEKRTGLLRCYISRVENGHTVPAVETLEKLARALEIPLYQLFYHGEHPPAVPNVFRGKPADQDLFASSGKQAAYLRKLIKVLRRTDEADRRLLLAFTGRVAARSKRRARAEERPGNAGAV
jgi:transcriptional regulator with XRE-family HTH domain